MDYSIRPLAQEDEPFLWQMLYEAAHLVEEGNLTVQDAKNNPDLAKYVKNWRIVIALYLWLSIFCQNP